jgi:hypothetical protein
MQASGSGETESGLKPRSGGLVSHLDLRQGGHRAWSVECMFDSLGNCRMCGEFLGRTGETGQTAGRMGLRVKNGAGPKT